MNYLEYWTGRGVEYEDVWRAYRDGADYIGAFGHMEVHVLQLQFDDPNLGMPLFNHEAVFKTVKGTFHDIKRRYLSPQRYQEAGPIYLYSVERGSAIWSFLGELAQLLMFGTSLVKEQLLEKRLDNYRKRLELLKAHFGDVVTPDLFEEFMRADLPGDLDKAFEKLWEQGLSGVMVSSEAFDGDIDRTSRSLLDVRRLLEDSDTPEDSDD